MCVGLDLETTAFKSIDPLSGLETGLASQNSKITSQYATVVLLDDMTPNPETDSVAFQALKYRIEGALTAAWRANNQAVADGTLPTIKLLLANFGSGAAFWRQAVDAIERASTSEHIIAVTGIGQSLDATREAVAALSAANIATVGSVVTADSMNEDLTGKHIQNFFRVAPLNTDEAKAALTYITKHAYKKILLAQDRNQQDSYAQTLASAFASTFESRSGVKVRYTESYQSPSVPLNGATRDQYMTNQFAGMHSDICADQPDLIYFAGRGTDLGSFLTALSQGGACSLGPLDVMSGDDASTLVGMRMPSSGDLKIRVFYTGLAHSDEWNAFPPGSDNVKNYQQFTDAFAVNGFATADLADGDAMMTHDAVLSAATAARIDQLAVTDPGTVAAYFLRFRCTKFIPGASGEIAFDQSGNPIDKAMPIIQIQPDGSVTQEDLAWPTGKPLDTSATC